MSRLIKNEWRPAARELPPENTPVLACKKNSMRVFPCVFSEGKFRCDIHGDLIEDIEWWCPFPRAPMHNFEGGWAQLNQSLRDGSIDLWCGIGTMYKTEDK